MGNIFQNMEMRDFENRFSNEDQMVYLRDADPKDIAAAFDRINPMMMRLPKREQDLLYMYFILKKRQTDLGIFFGRTQAAISYRIKKGLIRLKFLSQIPDITKEDMESDLKEVLSEVDVQIMMGMYVHTCQTQVARDMGSNQCHIRHRFYKSIKTLEKESDYDPKYQKYRDIFILIRDNTNILREVKLSRWGNHDDFLEDLDT